MDLCTSPHQNWTLSASPRLLSSSLPPLFLHLKIKNAFEGRVQNLNSLAELTFVQQTSPFLLNFGFGLFERIHKHFSAHELHWLEYSERTFFTLEPLLNDETTSFGVSPASVSTFSIELRVSWPPTTRPKMVCFLSRYLHGRNVMKLKSHGLLQLQRWRSSAREAEKLTTVIDSCSFLC